VQVVPASKNLTVVPVGDKLLYNLIDLLRLLGLATTLAKDNVAVDVSLDPGAQVALIANKTGFLRVLQVVAVTLGDLAVHCLLDPNDFVNQLVAVPFVKLQSESHLRIYDPNKQEAVLLKLIEGHPIQDVHIAESVVSDRHTSRWVG
jgi:hypothetical protein